MERHTDRRRFLLSSLGLAAAGTLGLRSAPAHAQMDAKAIAAYPDKPIRIVVPGAPGGGTDLLGRSHCPVLEPGPGHRQVPPHDQSDYASARV